MRKIDPEFYLFLFFTFIIRYNNIVQINIKLRQIRFNQQMVKSNFVYNNIIMWVAFDCYVIKISRKQKEKTREKVREIKIVGLNLY